MFKPARIKLTLWYLIIITAICICFSALYYQSSIREIDRLISKVEIDQDGGKPRNPNGEQQIVNLTVSDLEDSKESLLLQLILINLGVIVFSGVGGYFLAGRTLRPIKEMLDEQNRFVADASHELRTPLTTLQLALEGARRHIADDQVELKEDIDMSLEEVSNLNMLTDGLIELIQVPAFAKGSVGSAQLSTAIHQACNRVSPIAITKGIIVQREVVDALVRIDGQKLVELLTILLDNAIKYSNSNSVIEIKTSVGENSVLIQVRDEGIGIGEDDVNYIFKRFYRADKARSETSAGYGLGLSIAEQIVNSYEGLISVDSQIEKGSTFSITLPIVSIV